MRGEGRGPVREAGFTLVELMWVMALTITLLGLGAGAVRHYWQARSLEGAQDTVVAQLRQVQQRSMSESHPNVYGVRFLKGTPTFGVVRYNAATGTCVAVNQQNLGGGSIFVNDGETDFPDVPDLTADCRNAAPSSANYEVVFFYARGSTNVASGGTGSVKIRQPQIGKTRKVLVSRLTGRVTRS